jgi:Icc protein
MRLVHLSDLHVGGVGFVPDWADRARKMVNALQPDIIVFTGDLVDDGYEHEYEAAVAYCDEFEAPVKLFVPGNHDARNSGYEIFEEIFGTRYPHYESDELVICGIDSSQPDIDDGHIGRSHYASIRQQLSAKKLRFLALHHHLLPIPGTGRERNLPVDAGDLLGLCSELNVDFVLTGHKHQPWLWRLEHSYYLTAGTACTKLLVGRSRPSFTWLDIDEEIRVREVNVKDEVSFEILRVQRRDRRDADEPVAAGSAF